MLEGTEEGAAVAEEEGDPVCVDTVPGIGSLELHAEKTTGRRNKIIKKIGKILCLKIMK